MKKTNKRIICHIMLGVLMASVIPANSVRAESDVEYMMEEEGIEEEDSVNSIPDQTEVSGEEENEDSKEKLPENLNLAIGSKTFYVSDRLNLTFSADYASYFKVFIEKEDTLVAEIEYDEQGTYWWVIPDPGKYRVYFIAYNEQGAVESTSCYFESCEPSGEWVRFGDKWKYELPRHSYAESVALRIDGKVYSFDQNGYMITGWEQSDGKWYYYSSSGARLYGWNYIDRYWYYMNDQGIMQTGWQYIGEKWYYLKASGKMAIGWEEIGGKWYHLSDNGKMDLDWNYLNGYWYYMNKDGAMRIGWEEIEGKWYYFKGSGAMVTGWNWIGNKWYYFDVSGDMVTSWNKIKNKWYFFAGSGAMQTGWLELDDVWYYLEDSGAMAVGWHQVGNKWYYFTKSGAWDPDKKESDMFLGIDRTMIVAELEAHSNDSYYLGTRYVPLNFATGAKDPCMHPKGSPGKNGYTGLNCTGFVAFVLKKCGADLGPIDKMGGVGGYVNAVNWIKYVRENGKTYYSFSSVSDLLKSGKAEKGDLIYCEPDWTKPGADCHIGIFWGDTPSENKFWHQVESNIISNIKAGTPQIRYYLIKTGA